MKKQVKKIVAGILMVCGSFLITPVLLSMILLIIAIILGAGMFTAGLNLWEE